MNEQSIGVFDSGVGGLTVVKEIKKLLPNEKIIYFGDTKRSPYGSKTKKELQKYSTEIINFLLEKKCKAIVIACNTISANCLNEVKENFNDMIIIDVINPVINSIIKNTEKSVGIFATKATINSNTYENKIKEKNIDLQIFNKACPIFVNIIEEGFINTEMPYIAMKKYYEEFENKIDTLVLGCTHYPIILDDIKKVATNIKIINPAEDTSKVLEKILIEKNLLNKKINKDNNEYYYSGDNENFNNFIEVILNEKVNSEIINL